MSVSVSSTRAARDVCCKRVGMRGEYHGYALGLEPGQGSKLM